MSGNVNPFGKLGSVHVVDIKVDMDRVYHRHGKGICYHAQLSFDPAIFEPGSGKTLSPQAFELRALGFDQDDLEQLEAMGVSAATWENSAIDCLAGFGAIDAWLEVAATDAQTHWLEESGYLDDVVDMEKEYAVYFDVASLVKIHG